MTDELKKVLLGKPLVKKWIEDAYYRGQEDEMAGVPGNPFDGTQPVGTEQFQNWVHPVVEEEMEAAYQRGRDSMKKKDNKKS